jgi:hypothetical protein
MTNPVAETTGAGLSVSPGDGIKRTMFDEQNWANTRAAKPELLAIPARVE